MSDALQWLQNYYLSQCDGEWEHIFGIQIDTLDNPGWRVDIDLEATPMEGVAFELIVHERSEHDWVHCKVENLKFKGRGGPLNLAEILQVFRSWVEASRAS